MKLSLLPPLVRRFGASALLVSWVVTALRLGNVFLILPLILRELPRTEVGLWFLLLNLTQLFTLVEIGFQSTISRSVSFLQAGADQLTEFGISPATRLASVPNVDGLAGLLATSQGLYRVIAALAGTLAVIGGGGWLAWSHPADFFQPRTIATFLVLCLACPIGLAGLHWNAFLFGLNRVRDAQAIQLRALALNYAVSVIGLLSGGGILALAFGQLAMIAWSRWESWRCVKRDFPEISASRPTRTAVPWQRLWPMAWRTGIHTLFSYLAITASILVCGQVLGLSTTASYGLSFQGAVALHGLSNIWLSVKYPLISQMLAAGEVIAVRKLFVERLLAAMITFGVGSAIAVMWGPDILVLLGSKTPLLPTSHLIGLFVVVGLDLLVASHSSVLLLSNRATHLPNLIVAGAVHLPLAWLLATRFQVPGLIAAIAISSLLLHSWRTPLQLWRLLEAPAKPKNV